MKTYIALATVILSLWRGPAQAQWLDSYLLFANHTPLELTADLRVSGDADMVEPGQTVIGPWQNPIYHDVGSRVTVVILGVLFDIYLDHEYDFWMARSNAFSVTGEAGHGVEIDIRHNGELLFTVLYDLEDRPFNITNPATYNVRYPDGTLDAPEPWNLTQETQNSPRKASRQITIDGTAHTLIYGTWRADLDPTGDVIFSLSETEPVSMHHEADPADLENPAVINALTYNPGILMPLNANDQEEKERAAVFHHAMPKNMDFIVFQEFFQPYYSRQILDSLARWYPYRTRILNAAYGLPGIAQGGGVVIVSKYPILEEEDYSFRVDGTAEPGGVDAFANKGVKYARISKHGQTVHIFGTHTHGTLSDNNDMAAFMKDKLTPNRSDIVIMGGDMNTKAFEPQYHLMRDSFRIAEPTYLSLLNTPDFAKGTTWSANHFQTDRGRVSTIDYLFASRDFKVPVVSYNAVQVYRLNITDPDFWGIYDLGDHQPVFARFEFPTLSTLYADTLACPGERLSLSLATSLEDYSVEWYLNDSLLPGETSLQLEREVAGPQDHGTYRAEIIYPYAPDVGVNGSFYDDYTAPAPVEGQLIRSFTATPDFGRCEALGTENALAANGLRAYPNPASDYLILENESPSATWKVSAFSADGRKVATTQLQQRLALDVRKWAPGTYVLSLTGTSGESFTYRFTRP